ncbi:MAG TPA: 50S ribosomal protein L9, partial [Myxococcales bacterium]|nr:50S ribosomal protein L9 [Myxococcales bacterium]
VIAARQAKLKGAAEEQAKKLGAIKVTIKRKVGEQDKLYGSVTALDIAEAVAAQGTKIDRRHIHLPEPIKTVGAHEVEVRLHHDVQAKISVEVQPE